MKAVATWAHSTYGEGQQQFLWMHGWGYDRKGMNRLAGLFTANGTNRVYDMPGFGETPMLFDGAGTEDYADTLASQLEDGDNILIGHSYGGRVAVQLASKYPDKVKAIVLIGGAGLKRRRSVMFKAKAFALRSLGKLARLADKIFGTDFRAAYVERFGSADYKNAGPLRSTLVKAVNEHLAPQAQMIKCPALLLYGSDDVDTPPEIGRNYERLIPISRFVELKGYNHHDILTRGAYQCEALIKDFLKDLKND